MQILYDIPLFFLFILVISVCLIMGLAGTWLVRKNNWMLNVEDNSTATLAHAFVGVLYAVALGLMVVGVQSGYAEVEVVVMKEAYLMGDLYIDSEGLAEEHTTNIQTLSKKYINSVIIQEWPTIAKGNTMDEASQSIIDELAHYIITLTPQTDHNLVIYAELLDGLNELVDLRRERLHLGTDGVGTVTWIVVIMGALITIGMVWFYNTQSARAHYALVSMMSCMFGLMIFLIIAMDHPLLGEFSVSSKPFSEVLEDIHVWEKKF